MAQLPTEFTTYTRQLMGDDRFNRYLQSFEEEAPVSIRLNPRKSQGMEVTGGQQVPWCRNGYYLPQRPNFTMDPLLHAGCYYVQEASSMFLDEVLRQMHNAYVNHQLSAIRPRTALDLCAAPGGKSTLLRAALPGDCVLYSNEPMRNRANILAENIQKWGWPGCIVTNNYPVDYQKSKMRFDVILCDVPCSGEGMFRKDEATICEWSPQQVEKCWRLQREIVGAAWECLNDDGLFIYSTCTFNTKENEENIRWLLENYEAEVLPIETQAEWHITGSLLEGFDEPVYRFIPGITQGEGLFMCVLRKKGGSNSGKPKPQLNILYEYSEAQDLPHVALSYAQAIAYLRHEALILPTDTPKGLVTVDFEGHPLGMVKNVGTRANNLYPKEWKIKTTHIPTDYEPILKRL